MVARITARSPPATAPPAHVSGFGPSPPKRTAGSVTTPSTTATTPPSRTPFTSFKPQRRQLRRPKVLAVSEDFFGHGGALGCGLKGDGTSPGGAQPRSKGEAQMN